VTNKWSENTFVFNILGMYCFIPVTNNFNICKGTSVREGLHDESSSTFVPRKYVFFQKICFCHRLNIFWFAELTERRAGWKHNISLQRFTLIAELPETTLLLFTVAVINHPTQNAANLTCYASVQ